MRDKRIRFLLMASIVPLSIFLSLVASESSALDLDVNIRGVWDSDFVPKGNVDIDPSGDVATADLMLGDIIGIGIDVANPQADLLTDIFLSIVIQPDELSFLGGTSSDEILVSDEPGQMRTSLPKISDPMAKISQPVDPFWIQALSFASATPTSGTGPDIDASLLYFTVEAGLLARDLVSFDVVMTAGDVVGGASVLNQSGAVINLVPEPGSALLIGLGLVGLSCRRRAP